MGIFDIDSGADNHLLNEQFHVFSKSPASVATALGDASNRSGHTVTASDVWGQEIPAFFYAKTQAVADTYKSLAKTNDLCRIGNSVAIFENGDWVVKYNSYTDIPDGHKFKNANGDEVIRFHKNRLAYNLNLDNNAADDGLNTTAKIQGWDEENSKVYDYVATAPKFVTQFVTSTDKIVDGIPSKGFGPFVMAGTTTGDITKVLPEGTSDSNHYIANSFAGIIQFNKARTDAIYVHAFEYCGKTLKSAYSDIVELEDKLSKISVTASGGVQDASTDAKTAGFSVTTEKRTNSEGKEETIPVFDIETGSVAANETKLVTGALVYTAIEDAKNAAIAGSTVTLTADTTEGNTGITIDPNGKASNAFTVGIDQSIIATVASVTAISNIITDNKEEIDGKISTINGILEGLTSGDNSISAQISSAISNATSKVDIVDSDTSTSLVTAAQVSKYVGAIDTGVTSISFNGGQAQKGDVSIYALTEAMGSARKKGSISSESVALEKESNAVYLTIANAEASVSEDQIVYGTASNYIATADDADVIATFRANKAKESLANTAITGDNLSVSGAGISVTLGGNVGTPTLTGSITTASYTPASDDTDASWTNSGYLVTGATVEAFVGAETTKTLDAAKAYSQSLHTTSVTYHVTDTLPTVPAGKEEEYKGRIYLVLTGKDGVVAADGARIEYMYVNEGTEEAPSWDWEQIGTTTADLSGYAKSVEINGQSKTPNATGVIELGTVVTGVYNSLSSGTTTGSEQPNESSIYAEIYNGGLHIGVASATSSVMGVSKLFTGDLATDASTVTDTAVSVKSAQAMYGSLASAYASLASDVSGKADANNVVNSVNGVKGKIKFGVTNGLWRTLSDKNYSEGEAYSTGYPENDWDTSCNLWGLSVTGKQYDDEIKIADTFIGLPTGSSDSGAAYLKLAALPSEAVTVENNFVMNADGKIITTIRPERMYKGFSAQKAKGLKSFVGDLPNLTSAVHGDGNAKRTFYECSALELFIGDLSSLTDGNTMFANCSELKSFAGDLSSLTNGNSMFMNCYALTSFSSDLSSLKDGGSMFSGCKLDAESLECIADTLPTVTSGSFGQIGYNCPAADAKAAYDTITGKGWSCLMSYNA